MLGPLDLNVSSFLLPHFYHPQTLFYCANLAKLSIIPVNVQIEFRERAATFEYISRLKINDNLLFLITTLVAPAWNNAWFLLFDFLIVDSAQDVRWEMVSNLFHSQRFIYMCAGMAARRKKSKIHNGLVSLKALFQK